MQVVEPDRLFHNQQFDVVEAVNDKQTIEVFEANGVAQMSLVSGVVRLQFDPSLVPAT